MEIILKGIFWVFQASAGFSYYLAFVVGIFLLLAGLDDLLIDLYYWFLFIFNPRKLNPNKYEIPEDLDEIEQKPIAVFIPAWKEEAVIDRMLVRACRTIHYKNYDIFVGVYPNDPQTVEKVKHVSAHYPHVHAVIGRHNGPSTKAENLNEIHEGMLRWENLTGIRYDIIVMHDSEDVIHPLSLKLHNYFIPTYDMVQLPVYPIEVPHWKFVHWSYADEFAEHHTKDLVTRQIVSGFVPSAGVGTGYNRWLIEFVGTSFARNMFRKASLTEDYDITLRLALGSARLAFLYNPMKLPVGTRAYFPMTFTTAVRQKTRWMIGICLQSWKIFGWMGNLRFKLTLYHDRKAVITNIINGLAYLVLVDVGLNEVVRLSLAEYGKLPSIIPSGTVLFDIVMIDTGLMVWRFLNRFITVRRIYGPIAGLLSLIRLPIGNYINFAASVRGIGQYAASRYHNTTVKWDKTEHVHFPEMESEKQVTPWRGQWQRPEPGQS